MILCPPGSAYVTWSLLSFFTQAVPSSCIPPFPNGPLIMQGFTHLSPLQDIFTALSRSPTSRLQMCLLLPHAPGSLLASCPLSLACSVLPWVAPSLALSLSPSRPRAPARAGVVQDPFVWPQRAQKGSGVWQRLHPCLWNRIRSIQDSDTTQKPEEKIQLCLDPGRKQTSPGRAPLQEGGLSFTCYLATQPSLHPPAITWG